MKPWSLFATVTALFSLNAYADIDNFNIDTTIGSVGNHRRTIIFTAHNASDSDIRCKSISTKARWVDEAGSHISLSSMIVTNVLVPAKTSQEFHVGAPQIVNRYPNASISTFDWPESDCEIVKPIVIRWPEYWQSSTNHYLTRSGGTHSNELAAYAEGQTDLKFVYQIVSNSCDWEANLTGKTLGFQYPEVSQAKSESCQIRIRASLSDDQIKHVPAEQIFYFSYASLPPKDSGPSLPNFDEVAKEAREIEQDICEIKPHKCFPIERDRVFDWDNLPMPEPEPEPDPRE